MNKDVLKSIPNTNGYKINRDGTIIVSPNGTLLKSRVNTCGYKIFHLGKKKDMLVHRAVAFAFVENPNPSEFNIVNHKDENPLNNDYTNLEWCTIQYNSAYSSDRNRQAQLKNYPIELYETIPHQRGGFKRACNRRGLNFEDFEEIFAKYYNRPDGRKQRLYFYKKKVI